MLHAWQHNPEGVPTAIRQEDDGSLNLSDVDIWMWLKIITPSKGMMIRQRLMQLFGEAGQWASLVDTNKLPAPHSSKLRNSTRTEYKFMSLLKAEMSLRDLAIVSSAVYEFFEDTMGPQYLYSFGTLSN